MDFYEYLGIKKRRWPFKNKRLYDCYKDGVLPTFMGEGNKKIQNYKENGGEYCKCCNHCIYGVSFSPANACVLGGFHIAGFSICNEFTWRYFTTKKSYEKTMAYRKTDHYKNKMKSSII